MVKKALKKLWKVVVPPELSRQLQSKWQARHDPLHHGWHVIYALLPFAVLTVYLVILYIAFEPGLFWKFGALGLAYLFPPAGKESVIPLMVVAGIPWWLAAFSIALFDVLGALFITWNFQLALRIPLLGPWIERFMISGRQEFDRYPTLEHLSSIGLALFVMIPFEGSGGVAASIIGRMLGMSPLKVILSVAAGSILSSSIIALSAGYIIALFETGLIAGMAGVAIILAVILLLIFAGRRIKKKEKNSAGDRQESGP